MGADLQMLTTKYASGEPAGVSCSRVLRLCPTLAEGNEQVAHDNGAGASAGVARVSP